MRGNGEKKGCGNNVIGKGIQRMGKGEKKSIGQKESKRERKQKRKKEREKEREKDRKRERKKEKE